VSSIQRRLVLWLLCGSALVLALGGVSVYVLVTRSLEAEFDRGLEERVRGLASLLFQQADHVEFEFSQELMPEYGPGVDAAFFELWIGSELLERSDSAADHALERPPSFTSSPVLWSGALPDGRNGRYVARRVEVHHVYPELGPDRPRAAQVDIVIGRGTEPLDRAERSVLAQCTLGALVLLALLAGTSLHAVRRGLQPARTLAAALGELDVERLPERLSVGEQPRELAPIVETSNALIARIDAALRRERRTTADIAHELRTPISEILTLSEVALRNGQSDAGRESLRRVRDAARRMGGSVTTLLKLARIEMGAESFAFGEQSLAELVRQALLHTAQLAREKRLDVRVDVPAAARAWNDPDVLRIVVGNLIDNAVTYAPAEDLVRVVAEGTPTRWSIAVENSAPALGAADLEHLKQPFWRKDAARSDGDRSGLGLALSSALAERAGLTLAFDLERGRLRATLLGAAPAVHES
jgi:signal transduction histidine kinase